MFARPLPTPFGESCGVKRSDVCEASALAVRASVSLCEAPSLWGETGGSQARCPAIPVMLIPAVRRELGK